MADLKSSDSSPYSVICALAARFRKRATNAFIGSSKGCLIRSRSLLASPRTFADMNAFLKSVMKLASVP